MRPPLHALVAVVAAGWIGTSALPAGAQGLHLNEVYASQAGSDDLEFIELVGPPGLPLDGVLVLVVEGDAGPSLGTLDRIWDLSGLIVPPDGYLLLGDAAVPGADLVLGPNDTLENGTETIYVVQAPDPQLFAALLGVDVSVGATSTQIPMLGAVLDAVGLVDDGILTGDLVYDGAQQVGPDGPSAPPGIYRGFDFPSDWCTDFLDFDPIVNQDQPSTPGAMNGVCPASALTILVETNFPSGEPPAQTLSRVEQAFPGLQLDPAYFVEMEPSDPYAADFLPEPSTPWDLLTVYGAALGLLDPPGPFAHPGLDFSEPSRLARGVIDASVLPGQTEAPLPVGFEVWPEASAVPFSSPEPPSAASPAAATPTIADVLDALGVDRLHAKGITGAGVTIGIVDGGIDRSVLAPLLDSELGITTDPVTAGWPADWGTQSAAWFDHAHMTSFGALAVAPGATIYDLRISDNFNPLLPSSTPYKTGWLTDAIRAYQWAITRHKADGTPDILSNSWGIFQDEYDLSYAHDPAHPFSRKVVEALDEGIIVLYAAGNCGPIPHPLANCGTDIGPGQDIWGSNGHPRVITVGAADDTAALLSYSSRGSAALYANKPDFCAVSGYDGYYKPVNGGMDEGTSAACALSAGVSALLLEEYPGVSQEVLRYGLMFSAQLIGQPRQPNGFPPLASLPPWLLAVLPDWNPAGGAGLIQADRAYALGLDSLVLPALLFVGEPPATRTSGPNATTSLSQKKRYLKK